MKDKHHKYFWDCTGIYNKLLRFIPLSLVHKINHNKTKKHYCSINKDYTETNDMKFIWGIKSISDISGSKPNLLTMNDIDLIYIKSKNKYMLSVETMIEFKNGHKDEKEYLESLLYEFTNWMLKEGYNINSILPNGDLYSVFTTGYNINTYFNTVEDAYRTFSILVSGY